jgi:hypothetical protein
VPIEFESQLTTAQKATSQIIGHNGRVALIVVRAELPY